MKFYVNDIEFDTKEEFMEYMSEWIDEAYGCKVASWKVEVAESFSKNEKR